METTGREKTEMKIKTERVIIVTFLIVMLIIPAFCTADAPLPIRLLSPCELSCQHLKCGKCRSSTTPGQHS